MNPFSVRNQDGPRLFANNRMKHIRVPAGTDVNGNLIFNTSVFSQRLCGDKGAERLDDNSPTRSTTGTSSEKLERSS
jgi:hypothetical protein